MNKEKLESTNDERRFEVPCRFLHTRHNHFDKWDIIVEKKTRISSSHHDKDIAFQRLQEAAERSGANGLIDMTRMVTHEHTAPCINTALHVTYRFSGIPVFFGREQPDGLISADDIPLSDELIKEEQGRIVDWNVKCLVHIISAIILAFILTLSFCGLYQHTENILEYLQTESMNGYGLVFWTAAAAFNLALGFIRPKFIEVTFKELL